MVTFDPQNRVWDASRVFVGRRGYVRKRNLTIYLMTGFEDGEGLLARLGKHTTGKACLYVNRLTDVDLDVLRQLIQSSVDQTRSA